MVENLPAIQETWVRCLSWEDPLEEGMATHFSILAWRIPIDRGAWWATDHRVTKTLCLVTESCPLSLSLSLSLSLYIYIYIYMWRERLKHFAVHQKLIQGLKPTLLQFLFYVFIFWVSWCSMQDLSSLTRDRTLTPCSGSPDSQQLDCQGSPYSSIFFF